MDEQEYEEYLESTLPDYLAEEAYREMLEEEQEPAEDYCLYGRSGG